MHFERLNYPSKLSVRKLILRVKRQSEKIARSATFMLDLSCVIIALTTLIKLTDTTTSKPGENLQIFELGLYSGKVLKCNDILAPFVNVAKTVKDY